jgi:hypothetical protein
MKRCVVVAAILIAVPLSAVAGELQKDMKSRWLGAWVVTKTEAQSDCAGRYTNNRMHGSLVRSSGRHRFQPGELAKLDKVDLKKSRLDLMLTLSERLLVSYQDGPFTLYREVTCKVELEVMVPRDLVKSRDGAAIDAIIVDVLERYATGDEAMTSDLWNEREMDEYPEDYEFTLARHARWKAEQANARVQAKLDEAKRETGRLPDRIDDDSLYLAGFAKGVEDARGMDLDECSPLLGLDLNGLRRAGARNAKDLPEGGEEVVEGYVDGKILVIGLEMLRVLPECFVPVPDLPAADFAAYAPDGQAAGR